MVEGVVRLRRVGWMGWDRGMCDEMVESVVRSMQEDAVGWRRELWGGGVCDGMEEGDGRV